MEVSNVAAAVTIVVSVTAEVAVNHISPTLTTINQEKMSDHQQRFRVMIRALGEKIVFYIRERSTLRFESRHWTNEVSKPPTPRERLEPPWLIPADGS